MIIKDTSLQQSSLDEIPPDAPPMEISEDRLMQPLVPW